jgi:nucleoside-diphosphate-sugar epimerase
MNIAIHAVTGSQGGLIAAAFADHVVRPVTRAAGADLLDRASLEAAYVGADAVVLTLPVVYDERVLAMAENAARAAESAGVRHLVVNASGAIAPQRTGIPFQDARVIASEAAVPLVTVLAPTTTYLENLSGPWSAERIAGDGAIAYPVPGEATLAWVATADVGVAARRAIEAGVGGWFFLTGVPLTGHELAAELGAALGRELRWELVAPREYGELLRPHLGDHAAEGTAAVYEYMASAPAPALPDGGPAIDALGWEPRSVAEWAAGVAWPLARV